MLSDERINEIKERCEKAPSVNEWWYDAEQDLKFAMHAKQDIPDLLAEIERLRGELSRRDAAATALQRDHDRMCGPFPNG